MATRYTSNLRLRIEDNLTSDAVYNLQRIDELGAVFKLSTSSTVELSSAEDVLIQPNNPAAGGSGIGGLIRIGSEGQPADAIRMYASEIQLNATTVNLGNATLVGSYSIPWDRIDASSGGSVSSFPDFESAVLSIPAVLANTSHPSTIGNPHQTTAAQVGAYSVGQSDALLSAKANLSIVVSHTNATTGVHGLSGAVVGTTDAQELINKSISGDSNQITAIRNASIADNAAILGSKVRPLFGNQQVQTSAGLRLDGASQYVVLLPSAAVQSQPLSFRLPSSYGAVGQVLVTDGNGNLSWQNAAGAAISEETYFWLDSDGMEKVISHGFNTQSLDITIKDTTDNELIYVPEINFIDNSTITLISSEPPSNAWQVIIQGVAR
jgi:hypothetical protein